MLILCPPEPPGYNVIFLVSQDRSVRLCPCAEVRMVRMVWPTLFLLLLSISSSRAANKGSIQVDGYGEVWVIAPDWANIWVGGRLKS